MLTIWLAACSVSVGGSWWGDRAYVRLVVMRDIGNLVYNSANVLTDGCPVDLGRVISIAEVCNQGSDCIINVTHVVNQVVSQFVHVDEGLQVTLKDSEVLEATVVAGFGNWIYRGYHSLKGISKVRIHLKLDLIINGVDTLVKS